MGGAQSGPQSPGMILILVGGAFSISWDDINFGGRGFLNLWPVMILSGNGPVLIT